MLLVLSGVALVPFEANNAFEVDHRLYITIIYGLSKHPYEPVSP
jgi:hypothetical protein